MNRTELKEGMNIISMPNYAGTMHIYVYDGKVNEITLFNAKVTKKKTVSSQNRKETCNLVNMTIKTDW